MSDNIFRFKSILRQFCCHNQRAINSGVCRRLSGVSDAIKELLKNADGQFLSLCNDSQSLYGNIEQLRAGITHAAGIIDMSNDQSAFNILEQNADRTLSAFMDVNENIGISVDAISSLKSEIEELLSQCEKFRDSSHYLKIVRTNISMESVRTDRSRELFATLAGEIQNLSDNINDISCNMTSDLELARARQLSAEKEIRKGLDSIILLHKQAGTEIKKATVRARELVETSNQWLNEVLGHFKIISKYVSDIVISMQFHDIVRQRLEHVTEALDEIVGRISLPESNKKNLAYANLVTSLQIAQLENVHSDISGAYSNIKGAFSNIQGRLEMLNCGADSSDPDQSSRNDAFKVLIEELYKFNNFVEHATSLSSQTGKTIELVHQTTVALASYIRDIRRISRELSLKALNAIVLTERLGQDGKTLAVLTEEVYGRAGISQALGQEVTEVLSEITKLSEQMTVKNSEKNLENDIEELKSNIGTIDLAYKEYEQASAKTTSEISRIDQEVDSVIRYSGFMENLLSVLENQKEDLLVCEIELQRYSKYTDPELEEEMQKLRASYTMDSERQVHSQALGSDDSVTSSDDFGSIDLFDDDEKYGCKCVTVVRR